MTERPVDIVVRIRENVKKDLEKIEAEFREFKRSVAHVKSKLEVDDNGSINRANRELNRAARNRTATIYTRVVQTGGFPTGGGGGGGGLPGGDNLPVLYRPPPSMPDAPLALPGDVMQPSRLDGLRSRARGFGRAAHRSLSRAGASAARLEKRLQGVGQRMGELRRFIVPTMHQVQNVVAALIPALIQLGTAAVGVAAAFGAVALAGGAMVGLGLLGQGDTFAESMEHARDRVSELGAELFRVFQPAAQLFAPFAERFLDAVPDYMGVLAGSMPAFTLFEDDVLATTRGIIEWLAEGVRLLGEYQPLLSQINSAFGSAIGSAVLEFLTWVTEETYRNQEALMELGETFGYILVTIYNFALAFGNILIVLQPVFKLLAGLTALLSSDAAMAVLAFVSTLYVLYRALVAIVAARAALQALSGDLTAPVRAVGAAVAVGAGMAAATYMATPERQAMPQGVGGGASVTNNYNVNIDGDWSPRAQREMESFFARKTSESNDRSRYMTGLGA